MTDHSSDLVQAPNAEDTHNDSNPKISISDVLSLLRSLIALRLLHTTTSVLRIDRHSTAPNSEKTSAILRAIDRREQRITDLVHCISKDERERDSASEVVPPGYNHNHPPTATPVGQISSAAQGGYTDADCLLMRVVSNASTYIPLLVNAAGRGEDAKCGAGDGDGDDDGGRASCVFSSRPPPISDSVYSSSLRRCRSTSYVRSLSSGPRQCMLVPAGQYIRIASERQPQFSIVSQPWSIDSLVEDSYRLDRSALELVGHRPTRSAESFPGHFPVSDGLEYSSLATAARHLRIHSVRTSVRPFSDL